MNSRIFSNHLFVCLPLCWQGLKYLRLASDSLCSGDGIELQILLLLPSWCHNYRYVLSRLEAVLSIRPRILCMLSNYSTNWGISTVSILVFLRPVSLCSPRQPQTLDLSASASWGLGLPRTVTTRVESQTWLPPFWVVLSLFKYMPQKTQGILKSFSVQLYLNICAKMPLITCGKHYFYRTWWHWSTVLVLERLGEDYNEGGITKSKPACATDRVQK